MVAADGFQQDVILLQSSVTQTYCVVVDAVKVAEHVPAPVATVVLKM